MTWLTTQEAARLLGVLPATLLESRHRGHARLIGARSRSKNGSGAQHVGLEWKKRDLLAVKDIMDGADLGLSSACRVLRYLEESACE